MRVIPVIDLLGGVVVRGIAGRRSKYRPLESPLVKSSAPENVAAAFQSQLGLALGYLADLDAITGGEPTWAIYERLLARGFELWVDAGIHTAKRAHALDQFAPGGKHLTGIIVGLESVKNPDRLASFAAAIAPERRIFSLDLRAGRPLAGAGWNNLGALEIAAVAIAAGFPRMIVLDLAFVGVEGGPGGETLCRVLHARHPELELIGGGGVRHTDDLARLSIAGCSAALVASALHSGAINAKDLKQLAAPTT